MRTGDSAHAPDWLGSDSGWLTGNSDVTRLGKVSRRYGKWRSVYPPALLRTLRILVGLYLYLPGLRFARGSGPSASRTTVG